MGDLKNPRVIVFKGLMFLFLGLLSSAMLLILVPQIKVALLLVIAVWAFCRFYYFAFYVIEHYVDSQYKFSSLYALAKYLMRRYKSRSHVD